MQPKHFVTLVVVAVALAGLIGYIQQGTIGGGIRMALLAMAVLGMLLVAAVWQKKSARS